MPRYDVLFSALSAGRGGTLHHANHELAEFSSLKGVHREAPVRGHSSIKRFAGVAVTAAGILLGAVGIVQMLAIQS